MKSFRTLLVGGLAAASVALAGAEWGSETYLIWPERSDAPRQAAVVSWSDWLVFFEANSGKPGVRAILNEMAASGIREVWWRTFGGGHALYSSQVPGVTRGNYAGQGADYSKFDSLAEAVAYSRKLGLTVHAWFTPLEEAHAYPDNVRSRYVDRHPEFNDFNSAGLPNGHLSFYFPQYRAYKAALAREMLDHRVDGIILDFERGGGPQMSNQGGYLPAAVAEFNKKFKRRGTPAPNDPEWTRFRAEWVGALVLEIAKMAHERSPKAELGLVYTTSVMDSVRCNIPLWAKTYPVDQLCAIGKGKYWGHFVANPAAENRTLAQLSQKTRNRLVLYALNDKADSLAAKVAQHRAELSDIVWFETTYLHMNHSYGVPRCLALPDHAELVSPELDFAQGGELMLAAAGRWQLFFNGRELAVGNADTAYQITLPPQKEKGQLHVVCELSPQSSKGGIAVQGTAFGADGQKRAFASDRNWRSPQGKVLTIGQPGIPPLLAPPDRAKVVKVR